MNDDRHRMIWVAAVEHDGLEEVRKVPGYHDEPLKGDIKEDTAKFVSVEEVSKHDY